MLTEESWSLQHYSGLKPLPAPSFSLISFLQAKLQRDNVMHENESTTLNALGEDTS